MNVNSSQLMAESATVAATLALGAEGIRGDRDGAGGIELEDDEVEGGDSAITWAEP